MAFASTGADIVGARPVPWSTQQTSELRDGNVCAGAAQVRRGRLRGFALLKLKQGRFPDHRIVVLLLEVRYASHELESPSHLSPTLRSQC